MHTTPATRIRPRVTALLAQTLAGALLVLPAAAQDIPQQFESADALLDVLETADAGIDTFRAQVELIDDTGELEGGMHSKRRGEVFLLSKDRRAFRVDFKVIRLPGDQPGHWIQRPDETSFVFDGTHLAELQHDDKQLIIRQVVAPGNEAKDPLGIADGPFPLPIGQKKQVILDRFDASLVETGDGLTEVPSLLNGTVQLLLKPKRGTDEARDFAEIRVWYVRHDNDGDGTADYLLPRMARTVKIDGARTDARLINLIVNPPLDPTLFEVDAAPDGWEVHKQHGQLPQELDVAPRAFAIAQPVELPTTGAAPEAAAEAATPPDLSPALLRLLEADYLTAEEGRSLRVFHGIARDEDIDTPERAAQAALIAGVLDDLSLEITSHAEDRAEALLRRGDAASALETLGEPTSPRGIRIRVEANAVLGRHELAAAEAFEAARLLGSGADSAATVVEVVRMLMIRARIVGAEAGANDFHAMMRMLGNARQTLDGLHWPIALTEAELLYAKDSRAEAAATLQEVLALNPRCARAWHLLGRMSVDSFAFDQAEAIALRLDQLAGDDAIHPSAALLRARARLRQRDAVGAATVLRPVLLELPTLLEARALECAAEAARFYYPRVEKLLASYDELSPNSGDALLAVGSTLSEARQYEPAASYLNRAHERLPNWPDPLIALGLLEMQSGRDREALEALEKAVALDPFNKRADNSLRLARELRTYQTVESEHFIVRYRPQDGDDILAHEMLGPLERNHELVCASTGGGFDHEPGQKTIIELLPNHEWFGVRIAGMPAIHTIAASTGPVIAMEAPRDGPNHLGVYDWVRVLRHEYAHTVTLSRTQNRIPHWFTEAAAVYVEFAPRDYDTCRLLARAHKTGQLFDLEAINLAFVRPKKPTDRQQAYAQGHWMYEYIVETWSDRAPLELMDRYAEGMREIDAFEDVLGVDRETFMRRFKAWAQREVASWGLALADGTPSIEELLLQEAMADDSRREQILAGLADVASDVASVRAEGELAADGAWRPALPAMTDGMLARWRRDYPTHPEVLSVAMERTLEANAGIADTTMIPLLEQYAAARPVDPTPHLLLAKLYLDGNAAGPNAAIPHLEFMDARETRSAVYAIELARRYASERDLDRAWQKAERATQIAPYDADHRELAATVAIQRGDLGNAKRHIVALTVLEPDREIHRRRLDAINARM